jgi:hypothetical protein
MKRFGVTVLVAAALCLTSTASYAQLNGANLLGDFGVGSGTQPAPGAYVGFIYYRYSTDTIKKADGSRLTFSSGDPASMNLQAVAPLFIVVSKAKIFGAHYGFMVSPSFANAALAAPGFGLDRTVGTGAGDTYIVPITLGWHAKQADATVGFGIFAPTGRYDAQADDNIGKGMWSYELSAGTTVFFDPARTWSFAATGFWETHTKKKGTGLTLPNGTVLLSGITVGDLLTVEGGLGKSFLQGALSLGVAYYGQWKVSADDFGLPNILPIELPSLGKHKVYGFGPDVTLPIATKSKLIALVNVRYMMETGARVKTQGDSWLVTTTFPIPSVKITK